MPTVDRGRLDQDESLAPPRPRPSQAEPDQPVRGAETSIGTRADTELMTKSEDLEEKVPPCVQGGRRSDRGRPPRRDPNAQPRRNRRG